MTSYNTPVTIDNYTRFFANMFDEHQLLQMSTGFLTHFGMTPGSQTVFTEDEVIDIDIERANGETLAALVQRGGEGTVIGTSEVTSLPVKYTNVARVFPLLEETGVITATQINKRLPGEPPQGSLTRQERARRLALKIYMDKLRRSTRLFEYLAAQSVLTGEMPIPGGNLDFYRNSALTFTASPSWNNASGDPFADMDTVWDLIREHGKVHADMIVLGDQASSAYINNSVVQTIANNRRFTMSWAGDGLTAPPRIKQFIDGGMTLLGRCMTPAGHELWILVYGDGYTNSGGTYTKFMPSDKGYMCWSGARCDRFFGPPEVLPMDTARRQFYRDHLGFDMSRGPMVPGIRGGGRAIDMRMFYFDAFAPETHKNLTVRVQAAPIFATTHTDAFCVLNGLYV